MKPSRIKKVSTVLDKKASLGPIPISQIFPCLGFAVGVLTVRAMVPVNTMTCLLVYLWLCSSWWLLTGDRAWIFLSKFVPVPTFTNFYERYEPDDID